MKKQHSRAGFTLIEILVVIVIITILAGIVVRTAKYAITKGQRSRADSEIHMMENALESYKSDNGVYPPSTLQRTTAAVWGVAGIVEINNSGLLYTALAGGPKVYMTFKPNQLKTAGGITYIVDPFGSAYNYYCPPGHVGQINGATFDLWSYGPDNMWGVVGTVNYDADNITNWQQ
ncbi:MAG: prepilin-type N-terminal cleavage/methylation domain-containing protein [Verrucomicrobiia bacterium]|jgi:prepilin-type N-terminal cleavage/methylation domain-containing protein